PRLSGSWPPLIGALKVRNPADFSDFVASPSTLRHSKESRDHVGRRPSLSRYSHACSGPLFISTYGLAMADLLYLTELLGLKVFDLKGRKIGAIRDAAIVPLIDPVRVDRFLVGGGWAWLSIRHDQIQSISLDGIYLKDELLTPYHADEY